MTENNKEEKKNKTLGMSISIGIHALLLLLFFFLIAWQMPDPPPPGLPGMEINLGFVDAGSGDEQTNVEPTPEEVVEEVVPEEVVEESIINEEKLLSTNMEAPHEIKEVEKPKEVKKVEKKPVEEKKVTPVVDARNSFPNKSSNSDGDKNKKGDQGKPDGNPDSRNMFPGKGNEKGAGPGGNGASMEMPGWEWDSKPDKIDPTSESGYVLFEFFVDDDGSVIRVKKIGGANLTPTEDIFYKNQLLTTSFHLKDARLVPAKETRGVFKFEVRSK